MPVVTRDMAVAAVAAAAAAESRPHVIKVTSEKKYTGEKSTSVESAPKFSVDSNEIIPVGYYSINIRIDDLWMAIFANNINKITGLICVGLKSWTGSYYIKIFYLEHAIYLYFYDNVLFINSDDLNWLNIQIGGDFIQLLRENQKLFNEANLSFRVFKAEAVGGAGSMAGGYRRKNRKSRKGRKRHSKKRSSRKGRKTRSRN